MPHCRICDFCNTTNTPGFYQYETEGKLNDVIYDPITNEWICLLCKEYETANRVTYEEELIDREMEEDTSTVSELPKLRCLCDSG